MFKALLFLGSVLTASSISQASDENLTGPIMHTIIQNTWNFKNDISPALLLSEIQPFFEADGLIVKNVSYKSTTIIDLLKQDKWKDVKLYVCTKFEIGDTYTGSGLFAGSSGSQTMSLVRLYRDENNTPVIWFDYISEQKKKK